MTVCKTILFTVYAVEPSSWVIAKPLGSHPAHAIFELLTMQVQESRK